MQAQLQLYLAVLRSNLAAQVLHIRQMVLISHMGFILPLPKATQMVELVKLVDRQVDGLALTTVMVDLVAVALLAHAALAAAAAVAATLVVVVAYAAILLAMVEVLIFIHLQVLQVLLYFLPMETVQFLFSSAVLGCVPLQIVFLLL
jgi:hypothetical protein